MKTTTRRFPCRGDAERFLADEGFRFLGAPSRWRKERDGGVCYADVVLRHGTAVVIFTETRESAHDAG
ncbi:hypothetical protein [Azospirillum sp. ST 5-10]|uniref:hypothetical protein n=1 Tax=unclassified Azospirillum TaxID=2630922 RepID=UPI003F49CBCC